jgi:hypothetical protein
MKIPDISKLNEDQLETLERAIEVKKKLLKDPAGYEKRIGQALCSFPDIGDGAVWRIDSKLQQYPHLIDEVETMLQDASNHFNACLEVLDDVEDLLGAMIHEIEN